ncbi:MAG: hypothetical protein C4547_10785 [Phycisphaerales bacterium]|nr:MAG: hypothetical protein C4547_10785 [Phycisphaerales bacterium]
MGVFLVSAACLGFEISLMRILLVASWHHFAFIVISIAMLGFAASGTVLTLTRRRVLRHDAAVLRAAMLATAFSIPLCTALALHVPVEARWVPALLWRQLAAWALCWLLLMIPFFFSGAAIGLALMAGKDRVGRIYAANLAGSAAGGGLATAAMLAVPAAYLPALAGAAALLSALVLPPHRRARTSCSSAARLELGGPRSEPRASARAESRSEIHTEAGHCPPDPAGAIGGRSTHGAPARAEARGSLIAEHRARSFSRSVLARGAAVLAYAAVIALLPKTIAQDRDKYGAYVLRLVEQGSARQIGAAFGPRSDARAWAGDVFHDLPFLAVGASPPRLSVLTVDGHWAGSVLNVAGLEEAEPVEHTLMALPYAMAPPAASVLLLGESSGANVWLALRRGAARVTVVQPDTNVVRLWRGPLRALGGGVFDREGVSVQVSEPRQFVDRQQERHDVIQLALLEGSAAGSGGLAGLGQDDLMTVEGVRACLARLTPDGVLFACRGIQTPPRDNVKILATFIAALKAQGVDDPADYVAVVRDYLAVCTMVKRSPWTAEEAAGLRAAVARRELTPVWFPGIRDDELNRPDALPTPAYHDAAVALFSSDADAFLDRSDFALRPATDDRPFFHDFCRLAAMGRLRAAFGDAWTTRVEMAFPFVLVAAAGLAAAGALLSLVPAALISDVRRTPGRAAAAGYFAAIGLAYLVLELACLARVTRLIGDPVTSAAVVISTFLCASGVGSLLSQRVRPGNSPVVRAVFVLLLACVGLLLAAVEWAPRLAGGWALTARVAATVFVLAPAGLLMGFPMPLGLARLHVEAPALIPWAWGVNGFASVVAAPLATVIGMAAGFRAAGLAALALYAAAYVFFSRGTPAPGGHAAAE